MAKLDWVVFFRSGSSHFGFDTNPSPPLAVGENYKSKIIESNSSSKNIEFRFSNRIYLDEKSPLLIEILTEFHTTLIGGRANIDRTFRRIHIAF